MNTLFFCKNIFTNGKQCTKTRRSSERFQSKTSAIRICSMILNSSMSISGLRELKKSEQNQAYSSDSILNVRHKRPRKILSTPMFSSIWARCSSCVKWVGGETKTWANCWQKGTKRPPKQIAWINICNAQSLLWSARRLIRCEMRCNTNGLISPKIRWMACCTRMQSSHLHFFKAALWQYNCCTNASKFDSGSRR